MRLDISIGDIDNGNLNILNNDRATKAFSAVSLSLGSVLLRLINVYVVNVANATCRLGMRRKEGGKGWREGDEEKRETREKGRKDKKKWRNQERKRDREKEGRGKSAKREKDNTIRTITIKGAQDQVNDTLALI